MRDADKGINNASVRVENRKKLTQLLYMQDGLTKQELASKLRLSLPTINLLVQQLEDDGLISYQSSEQSSGGRIPNVVRFKFDAYVSVGINITPNHNRILILDLKGGILDQYYIFIRFEETAEYWQGLCERVNWILEKNKILRKKVLGVGMAIPGPVMQKEKRISSLLLKLTDFSFAALDDIFGFPIIMENDANSAGFAEVWMRDDISRAAYLSVSKGVGGAIIENRAVVRGLNNYCGEFGHMILFPNGQDCLCGKKGCLDSYISTKVLMKYGGNDLSPFFEKKVQDKALQAVWEEYLENLAIGMSNIVTAFDSPIILGGDISPYIVQDFERLKNMVASLVPFERHIPICSLSHLGENGAAMGSALLVTAKYLGML